MDTRSAKRAEHRIFLELRNRVGMLCVHGGVLAAIGVMMILTGSPQPSEAWFGPWARLVVGGAALGAGATLLVGSAMGDNTRAGWTIMTLGTAGAALWHAGIASTYAHAATTERMEILALGEALDESVTSRAYIPLVYLGYVLLVMIHCATLIRLGPPPRP